MNQSAANSLLLSFALRVAPATSFASALLVALLVALVPLQASAQGNASAGHGVTIDVAQISEISVSGAPSLTIEELGTWVEVEGESAFSVTTNAPFGRKIEVSAEVGQSANANRIGLGLRVKAESTPGGGGPSDWFAITTVGDPDLSGGDFIVGFGSVSSTHGLIYEARADTRYDPAKTTDFTVAYTVTGE